MDFILGAVVIGAIVIIALIVFFVIMRSIKIASPSEALIITGRNASSSGGTGRIIIGGRAVVYPVVQKAFFLSLSSRQIAVAIDGISMNGIALRLHGVAQVKVGGTEEDVRKAAQRFLDQQDQIEPYSTEILSGTLRAVVGTLTVEQIISGSGLLRLPGAGGVRALDEQPGPGHRHVPDLRGRRRGQLPEGLGSPTGGRGRERMPPSPRRTPVAHRPLKKRCRTSQPRSSRP